jgi:quinol monooxygenase YgiN
MLIVTGSVRARQHTIERAFELSLEYVHRCLLHSVLRDAEDPLRLVFLEYWADTDALQAHFSVPASAAFVHEVAALADESPEMSIYDARPVNV